MISSCALANRSVVCRLIAHKHTVVLLVAHRQTEQFPTNDILDKSPNQTNSIWLDQCNEFLFVSVEGPTFTGKSSQLMFLVKSWYLYRKGKYLALSRDI